MANKSFSKLIEAPKPLLIDFHAEWCGPCKMQSPILKELKNELRDSVRIIKIDIDKNAPLAQKLSIMGVPALHIYFKGELKWQATGLQTKHAIKKALEEINA